MVKTDLVWSGSGDSSGTGTYSVKDDYVATTTEDIAGGSSTQHSENSVEEHMTAQGTESGSGGVEGDFTGNGKVHNLFTLTDGSGDPSTPTAGFTVSYNALSD